MDFAFAVSRRLEDIRPGDLVSVRSTEDNAGVAIATDIDINVTTFDVLVTSLNVRGFALTMLDYHTSTPVRGTVYTGHRAIAKVAIMLPAAAIEKEEGPVTQFRCRSTGHCRRQ